MAKDACYFSHDSNARNDPKILRMRRVYRSEGYGWYWALVEMLRDEEDYKLCIEDGGNALAMQMQCEENAAHKFIADCITPFELFESDGTHFWSNSLMRRMERKEEKSEKARQAALSRWEKKDNANAMQTHSERNALKESKVKESKIYSSDLQADTEPKIVFNHLSEKWENIQDKHIDNWIKAYPACDIPTELARMKQWILANGAKGHKSNWLKFIINWLSRTQDRGGSFKN